MKTGMRLSRPARNWWAKEYKGASTVIDFCRGRAMQDGRSVPVGDLVEGHSTNYSINGIFIGNGDAVRLRDPSILSANQGTLLIECCQTFNPHSCIIDFGDDDHAIEVGSSATHVDHFNGSSVMTATAGVHNIHFMSRIVLTWGPDYRGLCFNGGAVARDYQGVGPVVDVYLGSRVGVERFLNGFVRVVVVFPVVLSEAGLKDLTA